MCESPVLWTISGEKINRKYSLQDYKRREDVASGKNSILGEDC